MKIKPLILVAVLMLAVLAVAVISGGDFAHDPNTVTVGIVAGEGYRITSENPVTVPRGEAVSFDIEILDGYIFRSAENFTYSDGKLTLDSATKSKSVYPKMGKYCSVTVTHTGNGTTELLSSPTVLDGENASVKITPDENYVIERITVDGKDFPIPADNTLILTVEDHTEIAVEFAGKSVTFMALSGNLGSAIVENSTDDFRYGDVLSLNCTFDSSHILFNGWSRGGFLSDGGELISKDQSYSYTITENTILYANFSDRTSYQIQYDPNFGTQLKDISTEHSPGQYVNLAVDNGALVRDGYTLIGYNTKKDGTGTLYSLGAMIEMPRNDITLYAQWAQETDPSYLKYTTSGGEVTITGLSEAGKAADLSVLILPKYIGGVPVKAIASGAFSGNTKLVRVIIPIGVTVVGEYAFANCTSLSTVYFPETITYLANNAVDGCTAFTNMRVLACLDRAFDYDYDSALADKYMRLHNTQGKRIIFVGGSNCTFGLNSDMIQERFPDYTVINFSCSAFYGILPLFDMLRANVRADDIVVFIPEYYNAMYAKSEHESMTNWQYLESNYDILFDINIQNNKNIFRTFTKYLDLKRSYLPGKKVSSDNIYIRSGFNSAGDLIVYRPGRGYFGFTVPDEGIITDLGMSRYNQLAKELTERGAECLFSFPPQPNDGFTLDYIRSQTASFNAKLKASLDSNYCTIISSSADYYFDKYLFFDSKYHLTLEGAVLRTEQLLQDLAAHYGN